MTALPLEPDSDLTERAHSARRQLTPSQVALVDRLIEAAADEAREHGYVRTTVRSAARRAGMAPATAYTYFASKDHLLAEVLWRRMADLVAAPPATGRSATERVVAELRLLGTFMSDDLEVAAAGTTALLGPGPDVRATRVRLGQAINERLATALGDDPDPALLRSLDLIYTGAVLWMGMGHLAAADVPDALEETGRLLIGIPRVTATTATDPVRYDPYDYRIHEDPYPTYVRLRDEAPLYHDPDDRYWALSRHADVLAGFRNTAQLSNRFGVSLDPSAYGPEAHRAMSFLAMDPPRHTRMRALVAKGFTPRRVTDLEGQIERLCAGHLDAALARGDFDFVADFAGLLPMDVIAEMLGVPPTDRAELRRLADLLVHREDGVVDVPAAGVEAAFVLAGYFSDLVAARRAHPTEDLTSALAVAEIDGDRLTDDEVISFLILMIVAGNETTTKLLANAWYWAWRFPAVKADVLAHPARVPQWVEETLRYDTSTQMLVRVTNGDVELLGQVIPDSSAVLLLLGSANRDPRAFPDPDAYHLDRDTSKIASFGAGRHFCLGASLARLEARVALRQLAERVRDYDIDESGARRVHSINVRGFAALPTAVQTA